jgi:chemotaxis response regulator CheB
VPIAAPIADDESLARKQIRRLLHAASGGAMIGKAANREEALRIAGEQTPRVVFLDVQLRLDGFERRDTRAASHGEHVFVLHAGTQQRMSRPYGERLDGSWQ